VVYKVFSSYLYNKLSEIVEKKISENQTGFRPNRSTIKNIHNFTIPQLDPQFHYGKGTTSDDGYVYHTHIVKQIYEKSHEYNIKLHNLFIDYTQAFDTVYRTAVIKSLKQFKIPIKLQNLITLTLQNMTAQVRVKNDLTEATDINTGVGQGDPPSALLFSTVIDIVMKNLGIRGNITTRLNVLTLMICSLWQGHDKR
jgi:hypothetical protein